MPDATFSGVCCHSAKSSPFFFFCKPKCQVLLPLFLFPLMITAREEEVINQQRCDIN